MGGSIFRSILDHFPDHDPSCPSCQGDGIVCEDHPDQPWRPDSPTACCKAAGMPCPIQVPTTQGET